MPQDWPVVGRVIVTCVEWNLVASAVEVAVMVAVAAALVVGVKVRAVADFTADVALRVPTGDGLTDRLTVFVNAPVPETVGVQDVVWTLVIDAGLHVRETPLIVGAGAAVMAMVAVPDLDGSALEVALMVSEPDDGTVVGAEYMPPVVIDPEMAVQEMSELKLPVPDTVAVHWLV